MLNCLHGAGPSQRSACAIRRACATGACALNELGVDLSVIVTLFINANHTAYSYASRNAVMRHEAFG